MVVLYLLIAILFIAGLLFAMRFFIKIGNRVEKHVQKSLQYDEETKGEKQEDGPSNQQRSG